MLYDIDDEKEKQNVYNIEEGYIKSRFRTKIIICGIIVIICFIVVVVTIIISYNITSKKNEEAEQIKNSNETIQAVETKKEEKKYVVKPQHVQIAQHDLEKIKLKFVPKQNLNAQQEITNIYYSDEKIAYLTFDDGPSKNISPLVLDILKQENVPATFFVLGSRVELNPDILRREFNEGHYIANHGYSHKYSQIYESKDTVFEEYIKCENAIRNALNNQEYNTYLFRFPGGSSGGRYASIKAEAKEMLNNYGVNHTNWNCLTGDAEGKTTPEELMGCLQESMNGDGSLIVLMHDASDKTYTAETLPQVISYLREQGYIFKNFYEIFK